jgi:hypothetical protein
LFRNHVKYILIWIVRLHGYVRFADVLENRRLQLRVSDYLVVIFGSDIVEIFKKYKVYKGNCSSRIDRIFGYIFWHWSLFLDIYFDTDLYLWMYLPLILINLWIYLALIWYLWIYLTLIYLTLNIFGTDLYLWIYLALISICRYIWHWSNICGYIWRWSLFVDIRDWSILGTRQQRTIA